MRHPPSHRREKLLIHKPKRNNNNSMLLMIVRWCLAMADQVITVKHSTIVWLN